MLFGGVYILNQTPLIVGAMGVNELHWARSIKGVRAVIYWPAWYWTKKTIPSLYKYRLLFAASNIKLRFACNSNDEVATLKSFGISAELINLNCFVNENTFHPIHSAEKKYDAIYIAQMLKIKRLELAKNINKLFVVTYGERKDKEGNYDLHSFEPEIQHCEFNKTWIPSDAIAVKINESAVSLALSPHEGAMLAVVESLLCGTPVLSTPCKGGRELFFHDDTARICKPDPFEIARVTKSMSGSHTNKNAIRNITLAKIYEFRRALDKLVDNILDELDYHRYEDSLLERFSTIGGSRALYVDRKNFENQDLL
jgi:glycosyltransferase involved in cell wall biosynthesis